ncbi:hypothetical protein AB9M62_24515 [Bacillales bacterium AN1005]
MTIKTDSGELANKIKELLPDEANNVYGINQNFIWEYYGLGPFFF